LIAGVDMFYTDNFLGLRDGSYRIFLR